MTEECFHSPPKVIFGTSTLGNLYEAPSYETKLKIIKACFEHSTDIPLFDCAGKYGAGLALESLSMCLNDLQISKQKVLISNKLGWYRVPLSDTRQTFEPDVWKELGNNAVQKISYHGILECYEQGNQLLNGYHPQLVSVHDPDEYIASGETEDEKEQRYNDIIEAYTALLELKKQKKVLGVGIGSKDWKVIQRIESDVTLDWVMFANSFTILSHTVELANYMKRLKSKNILIINSAVFNGGFLIGSDYYNYEKVDPSTYAGRLLYTWRDSFFEICSRYNVRPAEACLTFGLNAIPHTIASVALNAAQPQQVKENIDMLQSTVNIAFWKKLADRGLILNEFAENLMRL